MDDLTAARAHSLYKRIKTYSGVAAELGVSPTTAKKLILWRRAQIDKALAESKSGDPLAEAYRTYEAYGSYSEAARQLGVSATTVKSRIDKFGIERDSDEDGVAKIESDYLAFVSEHGRLPSLRDLSFSDGYIRKHFPSAETLHDYMSANFGQIISEHVVTDGFLFTQQKMDELDTAAKKYKRFVISTAVSSHLYPKKVDINFFKSIKSYCEKNDAKLIVLMCQDVASTRRHFSVGLDPVLKDELIVVNDVKLNSNLHIYGIKTSAKQINPITGMARHGQRNGSFIYASPKQFLKYVSIGIDTTKMPHAMMTTGALTVADYSTEMYMSHRTSRIAEGDHVMGAIIVEIDDDEKFHFRQVQATSRGEFTDLCTTYYPTGKTKVEPAVMICGDYHAGATDPVVREAFAGVLGQYPVKEVVLHDFFDGFSINPHEEGKFAERAWKSNNGYSDLIEEFKFGADELNWILSKTPASLTIVKSNHDEFLDRFIERGEYIKDTTNWTAGHETAIVKARGEDPLKYAYHKYGDIKQPNRIRWLQRTDSYEYAGVQIGAHGDKGSRGAKGSVRDSEIAFGNCIIGHWHSAEIMRSVWVVGTFSKFNLRYTVGSPSNWTHTFAFLYANGTRQLINFIHGKHRT